MRPNFVHSSMFLHNTYISNIIATLDETTFFTINLLSKRPDIYKIWPRPY